MRVLIVSDVHLEEDLKAARGRHFLGFLESQAKEVDRIYVLGDLFDVWPGTSRSLLVRYAPVFQIFSDFIRRGGQVHYIEGNHDFQLGKALEQEVGLRVYTDSIYEEWDGKKILFCHGDTVNEDDVWYLRIRSLLRSGFFRCIRFVLPDRFSLYLGTSASRMSRETQLKRPDREARKGRIQARYREVVGKLFRDGRDVVVMGHTHIPEDYRFEQDERTCRYLNSGDWVENFTFIRYESGDFKLLKHPFPKTPI